MKLFEWYQLLFIFINWGKDYTMKSILLEFIIYSFIYGSVQKEIAVSWLNFRNFFSSFLSETDCSRTIQLLKDGHYLYNRKYCVGWIWIS